MFQNLQMSFKKRNPESGKRRERRLIDLSRKVKLINKRIQFSCIEPVTFGETCEREVIFSHTVR